MKEAFTTAPAHFYIGIPCLCRFGWYYITALEYLNLSVTTEDFTNQYHSESGHWNLTGIVACPQTPPVIHYYRNPAVKGRITTCTAFLDGNYVFAHDQFTSLFKNLIHHHHRSVHMILGSSGNVSNLPFPVNFTYKVSTTQAFEHHYQELKSPEWLHTFAPGDIMLITAGPLGRILAVEWSKQRPDMTFLELGSFFDSLLWHRVYDNHSTHPCMFLSDYGYT